MTTSYSQLLRDPRWQKKRLDVMQRAGFACEDCKAIDKTLHVHHGYYEKNLLPWEYDDETLHCYCEDCHDIADIRRLFGMRAMAMLNRADYCMVMGFIFVVVGGKLREFQGEHFDDDRHRSIGESAAHAIRLFAGGLFSVLKGITHGR